ncbi:threonine ammonia-lyase [Hyphomonadaceae bacterium BL14]|nr:threonine ammonia-lyase [Hyphomonadaceae bacterium BL14]
MSLSVATISPDLDATLAQVWRWHDAGLEGIVRTPFLRADRIGEALGCELWVKLETLQHTGSFKERGALARLMSLTTPEREAGVVAASAGNHAQGVARHAARLGVRAVIVMPRGTPIVKIQKTEGMGAEVVIAGESFDEAQARAGQLAQQQGLTLIHPFDDPWVIAGQSTIAREMLAEQGDLDVIIAPVGGGGLLSGLALAARAVRPDIEIIGVQAALYPSMANRLQGLERPVGGSTLAEGIAVKAPGGITAAVLSALAVDFVLVGEPALERALYLYLTEMKVLAEGAGAAGLAGVLEQPERFAGRKVATVLCGGNIDTRLLSSILLRGLVRSGRMARLRIELIDVPGQLVKVSTVIAQEQGNVIDVAYHRVFSDLPAKVTYIDISVEAHDRAHMERILTAVKGAGFKVEIAAY